MHVAADGTNLPDYSNTIFDISDDLVQGALVIRTNGVHTFNFQLQNTQRKYDGILQPMDRITVEMKRVTWVRVFSGYLNNGPVFSTWPRVLNMSASCTLKRLQFWYWDPTTIPAYNLITSALNGDKKVDPNTGSDGDKAATGQQSPVAPQTTSAALDDTFERERIVVRADNSGGSGDLISQFWNDYQKGNPSSAPVAPASPAANPPNPAEKTTDGSKTDNKGTTGQQKFDDSIKGVVLKILNDVVGWPQEKVHIGAIPENWVKLASEVGNLMLQKGDVRDMLGDFSQGDQTGAGSIDTSNPNGPVPPGNVLDWCKAGLTLAGLPLSYAPGLAEQAMFESSGNPHNIQHGVDDVNSRAGNPAKGLLQMIPTTFMAHAVPGHTDIFNPIDNSASAARYALGKYGPGWFRTGTHTHGF